MSLSNPVATEFVHALLDSGRVSVPPDETALDDLSTAVGVLDAAARPELAFEPPALSAAAAAWALEVLYRACQALVFREVDAAQVRRVLARPCPAPPSPAVCYSADLALRYLPDVLALARGIAPDDPLVGGLTTLARAWPLSSVGVPELGEVDPWTFLGDRSLRQLYVDRIIERGDAARLAHPEVRAAVRESLGAYPELAPKLTTAL